SKHPVRIRSGGFQVRRRWLAARARDVERNPIALAQRLESSGLDGGDVDVHVLGTILRLDESEPLRHVEELHLSDRHVALLLCVAIGAAPCATPRATPFMGVRRVLCNRMLAVTAVKSAH